MHLKTAYRLPVARRKKKMNPKIQGVVEFMRANLHRKLLLGELAESANLSRPYLCRLFKTEIGVSPVQYLQTLRMKAAGRLLATTLMSIKQVMLTVGYTHKSLFVGHFKKAHGLTPSEYRAKQFAASWPKRD
jgi:transcriptional regulator GlxA family with amidase domain